MKKRKTESGTIDYSGRAFHQDAMEAMGGDIVRGIIELLTNSDDAYASMSSDHGRIMIEVEHRRGSPWRVVIKDRACGMTGETMKLRLARLGGRTSGFEAGENRRGNLGRGAKDLAAFGEVDFESIREDRYARFILHTNANWDIEERDSTTADRKNLGIARGNGTVVTVHAQASIRCPQHENLVRRLAQHYQLRDILSDPRRKAELRNLNNDDVAPLHYSYPRAPEAFNEEIHVEGYPGASARLTLWRLSDRYDEGPADTGRPNGILIKGTRAIYENTLFNFEGNVHAGWFSGKLECPYIDRLAREYDDRLARQVAADPSNPIPIISRRRDGLSPGHPFVQALRAAVEVHLGKLVADEAERARRGASVVESTQTRAALDRLAREVGRLVSEELREIDAESLPGDDGEGQPPALAIVPQEVFAYMGEDRTLTVVARRQGAAVGDTVLVQVDPSGVVELLTPTVTLQPHTRREDVLVAQIRLRPLLAGESSIVTASLGHRTADALAEVKPPRQEIEEPIVAPDTLSFERPAYRVGLHRVRDINLVAPAEFVARCGPTVNVTSSDPGVVIRSQVVELKFDDAVDFFRSKVTVEGRLLESTATITARSEDQLTTAQVRVTQKEEGPSFRIALVEEEMGLYRAITETETTLDGRSTNTIKIAGRHPGISAYIGSNFEGQNSPAARAMMAEVVADMAARLVVSALYRSRRNTEAFDADRFYREHYKRITRFLPRFQKLLLGDPETARTQFQLGPLPGLEARPAGGDALHST